MTAAGSTLVIVAIAWGYVLVVLAVMWARHQDRRRHHERRIEHERFMHDLEHYRTPDE